METQRKLSPWRLSFAIIALLVVIAGSIFAVQLWQGSQISGKFSPWFAPYVDVTAEPTFAFEQLASTQNRNAMLAFIVSSDSNPCAPTWGKDYTLDQARDSLDLERRIARLRQQKGNIGISFGGLANSELALKCTDQTKLHDAYKSVVDRYSIDTIDLDLEQASLTDKDAATRRAVAIASLQKEQRAGGKHLAVWVTLPVDPNGLTENGTNAVSALLAQGVDLAGVNIMTMDYGDSLKNQTMIDGTKKAMVQTVRQLGILYDQAKTHLNDATLWSKLGVTPMIGQNDDVNEVFTLTDATALNDYAKTNRIGRVSMWSANRDVACGSNYADPKIASDSCSGVSQSKFDFINKLGSGYTGSLSDGAGIVTAAESATAQKADDPATSPYQIWSATGTYLEGTKVVWHHNVYQAKWWTQGDTPDNPVLQSWQTPWELIGPVLPGEKPIPQSTLPAGTYPDWSGTSTYDAGQRVLFNGVPYQSKWWNQGQSPAAAASNQNSSPWVPLTQTQINDLQKKN